MCHHKDCTRAFGYKHLLRRHVVQDDGDPPPKRRRGGECGRDWTCDVGDCDKDFKTVRVFFQKKNAKSMTRIPSTDKGITDTGAVASGS